MRTLQDLISRLSGKENHSDEVRVAVSKAAELLIEASLSSPEAVMVKNDSSEKGLTESEAQSRLERFGKNETAHEKAPSWIRQLVQAFFNPFVGILILLAVASFVTEYIFAPPGEKDLTAVVIISILVLISAILTFIQEYQANKAADQLLSLIQNTALVERRDQGRIEVVTTSLVPGDIIHLSAGDIVPADVRIIFANNLIVNEAALTGESLPVDKKASPAAGKKNQMPLTWPISATWEPIL